VLTKKGSFGFSKFTEFITTLCKEVSTKYLDVLGYDAYLLSMDEMEECCLRTAYAWFTLPDR
jgi:hypothetical protein